MHGQPNRRTKQRDQLNSIRARKTKFVCVNDDMKHPTPELVTMLQDFYLSFFPFPSRFELPPGVANAYLHLDAYQRARRWQLLRSGLLALLAAVLIAYGASFLVDDEDDNDSNGDSDGANGGRQQRARAGDLKED